MVEEAGDVRGSRVCLHVMGYGPACSHVVPGALCSVVHLHIQSIGMDTHHRAVMDLIFAPWEPLAMAEQSGNTI